MHLVTANLTEWSPWTSSGTWLPQRPPFLRAAASEYLFGGMAVGCSFQNPPLSRGVRTSTVMPRLSAASRM